MRKYQTIVWRCLLALVAATLPIIASATAAEKQPERPLHVSLFPYVPDKEHIRKEVQERWDKLNTGVKLGLAKYEEWDCYSKSPPDDLDVFELDAINLDYFVRGNWVSPLTDSDVENSEDILDFAWKGCFVDGHLYGVPRLACTFVLFYRTGDDEIAGAKSLGELARLIGDTPDNLDKPEPNRGLLINLRSGTDCACLYLDARMDSSGIYSPTPILSPADSLDEAGLGSLTLLRRMAGKNLGLHEEPKVPDRPKWFAQGLGRVFVGYSERLYFMPKESHAKLRVRELPLAQTNAVNLFFVDLLAVNPLVRGERRKLAMKFINLCASSETVTACLMPATKDKPSQYLLPVRRSVIENRGLLDVAPLYRDLGEMLCNRAVAFRMGADARRWLGSEKRLIQARIFAFP
jgi:thiamine pyridinylase